MFVEHHLHVAVLLIDLDLAIRVRKVTHDIFDDLVQKRFLLAQPFLGEIAHDEGERRTLECCLNIGRMQETLAAFGGFG